MHKAEQVADYLPILLGYHQARIRIGKHRQEHLLKGVRLDHE